MGGQDVITIAFNMATEGFKKGTKQIEAATKSLAASVKTMGNKMTKSVTGVVSSFKRLIPTIIGVSSVYGVLSKAVSSYMSQNEELSQRLSSIWTALGNVIGPIIEKIIDWITTAVSYFLSFLQLLGVTTKTASQLSQSAKKSTAELKKTVAGFDELNVMTDNSSSGNNSAGLKDVEPSEFMKKLSDMLKNKLWDDAADLIIDKMNNLIYAFRDKAYELGDKIGEYLGAALHIIGRVIDEVDWRALGEGLANLVNGIFNNENMKGEDLGKILVAKFTIAFKVLTAFLENLDTSKLGEYFSGVITGAFDSMDKAIKQADPQKMGQNIANFFNNIKWNDIAVSISTFLNDAWDWAVTALKSFLSSLDARAIGEGIRTFFKGIDWEKLASDILDILQLAWEKAIDLLWGLLSDGGEEPPIVKSLKNIGEQARQLLDDFKPLIDDYLKPALEWFISEGLPKVIDFLANVIDKIGAFVSEHPELTFDMLKVAVGALIALDVVKWFSGLADEATKTIKPIRELISMLGGGAGGAGGAAAAGSSTVATAGTAAAEATGGLALSFGTLASALSGGLLAALGLVPVMLLDTKLSSNYAQEAFEETGGSVELMAQKMNEFAETASHYEECLYDTTGATTELGWSVQESRYAMEAYNEFLPILAEQLGLTTEELRAQIEAAGGDVTQIEALRTATSELTVGNTEAATSQNELNTAMDDTAAHIEGAGTAAVNAAKDFQDSNKIMQESATETDAQADVAYSNIETNVSEKTQGASGVVETESDSMERNMTESFNEMERSANQSMPAIERTVTQAFNNIARIVSDKSKEAAQAAKTGFQEMAQNMKQETDDASNEVSRAWDEMTNDVTQKTDELSNNVTTSFSQMSGEVMAMVDELVYTVIDRINYMAQEASAAAAAMSSNFSASVSEMPPAGEQAANETSEAIGGKLGGLGDSGSTWGYDLAAAIAAGIRAGISEAIAAAAALADAVSSYLHFSEPDVGPLSNFHTFAPDMMKMYVGGIMKGRKSVLEAAESIASDVSDEFTATGIDLDKIGGNMKALNGIAQSVSFKMPVVAGGGFTPYSVGGGNYDSKDMNIDFSALMRQNEQIIDVMSRILNVVQEGKVIAVDKYKFGELLVKTLASEARASGKSII